MKYKSVVVSAQGGPETLVIQEHTLRSPRAHEAIIKTLACAVSLPDVQARYGHTPFAPKVPFTPGYAIVGDVEAVGSEVNTATIGDRVSALTTYGGYAEYVIVSANDLIPTPDTLDPVQIVPLILNYLVAYQTLHRSAKVAPSEKALIVGASGGIGTAMLQLGRLAGLELYGLASKSKHAILKTYGATAIDYNSQDFVEVIRKLAPEGLDVILDGIGGPYLRRGMTVLKRGGRYVGYGNPLSLVGTARLLTQVVFYHLLPNGKAAHYYGTGSVRFNRKPFVDDWTMLFRLLQEGKINPIIMQTFPLLQAAEANALLESGKVIGNLVLVAPETLLYMAD